MDDPTNLSKTKIAEADKDWLQSMCQSYFNPKCPMCGHDYSSHSLEYSPMCTVYEEGTPSTVYHASGTFYQKTTVQCNCQLSQPNILYNLHLKAKEALSTPTDPPHEPLLMLSSGQPHQHEYEQPYPPVVGHLPYYDCCEVHNTMFNGPSRVNTVLGDGGGYV